MAQKNGYRMESGFSIPSTFKTGYDYARMFGIPRIGFFGVDSLSARKLADNLSEFATVLPRGIALTMAGDLEPLTAHPAGEALHR